MPGKNVLAIHLMNAASVSQDAVVLPELFAGVERSGVARHPRYMQVLAFERDKDPTRGRIVIGAERGRRYQVQISSDMTRWFNSGEASLALGTLLEIPMTFFPTPDLYYRVVELE